MISPFFIEQFVYCNKCYGKCVEEQVKEILEAIRQEKCTTLLCAYKKIIEEVKGCLD